MAGGPRIGFWSWALRHRVSEETAEAIFEVAQGDENEAERVWSAPSPAEVETVKALAKKLKAMRRLPWLATTGPLDRVIYGYGETAEAANAKAAGAWRETMGRPRPGKWHTFRADPVLLDALRGRPLPRRDLRWIFDGLVARPAKV